MYVYIYKHTHKCMRVCIFQYFLREKFGELITVMLY